MLALYSYREVALQYRLCVAVPLAKIFKEESLEITPLTFDFPLVGGKAQCPFCIGDESKTYQ